LGHSAAPPRAGAVDEELLDVDGEPAGFCVQDVLLRLAPVLGSVLEALAQDDSRDALPAEAPVASELELELDRGLTPVRSGKPPVLLREGGAGPSGVGVCGVLLAPAGAPAGPAWAKAAVAPQTARADAATRVVMVRIWESSLSAPAAFRTPSGALGSPPAHQLCR
jgi:hypothetical protein